MAEQTVVFLRYLPLNITLVSMETAQLPPYLGSTLRGAIGQALHQNIGAFNYLYNNRVTKNNEQDTVNPYIIVPPDIDDNPYEAGEALCFSMLLLGDAAQYVLPVIDALNELKNSGLGVQKHPFKLIKVTHGTEQRIIWQNDVFYPAATQSIPLPWRTLPNVRQVTMRICTPLRIRRGGEVIGQLDFPTVIRNITRRVEAITQRYGGWTDSGEAERILTLSSEVATIQSQLFMKGLERFSNRLGTKLDLSGLMGMMRFEGDLTPFVPWLFAAQALHIGRNTTFGMGRVEMEFL